MSASHNVGIISPGAMGTSVAAALQSAGHSVYWVASGRSSASKERAATHNLQAVATLEALCRRCSVIVSVCPPHLAESVARDVAARSFSGLYIDANAISPARLQRMAALLQAGGAACVDGSIMGPPAWKAGTTTLCLSGARADEAAELFANSLLETRVVGSELGAASAVKMCFAAYTKGTTALLGAIFAVADATGVEAELREQWRKLGDDFAQNAETRVTGSAAKAWRWSGEMEEIAATFEESALPGGFHQAAAEIFTRLAVFKDEDPPALSEYQQQLQQPDGKAA